MSFIEEQAERKRYTKILKLNKIEPTTIDRIDIIVPANSEQFSAKCEKVIVEFLAGEKKPPLKLFAKKFNPDNAYVVENRRMELFQKEAGFYNLLLPDLNRFCEQRVGCQILDDSVIPKLYYADEDLILLEDLEALGYGMMKEFTLHNLAQATKVIEILAKLHATSYTLIESMGLDNFVQKYPFTKVNRRWTTAGEESHRDWVDRVMRAALKNLKKCPVPGSQDLVTHLENYGKRAFEKIGEYYDLDRQKLGQNPHSCGFVLNHADAWNCNTLFPKEGQECPEKCMLIDFQTIHVGSPVLDLQYYLFLTAKVSVRTQHWMDLLRIYFDTFKEVVTSLQGHTRFSFENLVTEYKDNCEPGFLLALGPDFFFPVPNGGDASTLEKMVETDTTCAEHFSRELVNAFEDYKNLLNN